MDRVTLESRDPTDIDANQLYEQLLTFEGFVQPPSTIKKQPRRYVEKLMLYRFWKSQSYVRKKCKNLFKDCYKIRNVSELFNEKINWYKIFWFNESDRNRL